MRRAAERAGFDSLSGPGYWEGLASLAEWDGDLDGALGLLEEGRQRQATMLRGHSLWYTTHEAGLALELGDLDKAAQLFDELRPGVGLMASSWYGLAVHIACRRGDLAEARRLLPELVSLVAMTGARGPVAARRLGGVAGRRSIRGRGAAARVPELRRAEAPGRVGQRMALVARRPVARGRPANTTTR